MRIAIMITAVITIMSILYKWRYRIMNTMLAITFLRKLSVLVTMNMPLFRKKVLPMFLDQSTQE